MCKYLLSPCSAIHHLLLRFPRVLVIRGRCVARLVREGLCECSSCLSGPWPVAHLSLAVSWVPTEKQMPWIVLCVCLQIKVYKCFLGIVKKKILPPKNKNIFIYSPSCHSRHMRFRLIFVTQMTIFLMRPERFLSIRSPFYQNFETSKSS